jgi:hypothetical protein
MLSTAYPLDIPLLSMLRGRGPKIRKFYLYPGEAQKNFSRIGKEGIILIDRDKDLEDKE